MVTAKNIETSLWNKVIDLLIQDNWVLSYQYDGMDAGIDYNAYTLKRGNEEIKFEWTNWFEGEIKCSIERIHEIEMLINEKFKTVE